jgi:hypothetical protein
MSKVFKFKRSKNSIVEDLLLQNSGTWTIFFGTANPSEEYLRVRGLRINPGETLRISLKKVNRFFILSSQENSEDFGFRYFLS